MSESVLNNKIEYLKGVGPARAEILNLELSVFEFQDLLNYFPFRYIDRTRISPIASLSGDDNFVQISGFFDEFVKVGKTGHARLEAIFHDDSAAIKIIWFQNFSWVTDKYKTGTRYYIFGRVGLFSKQLYMAHPEILTPDEFNRLPFSGRFQPIYQTSEKLKSKGIDSKAISMFVASALEKTNGLMKETLPASLLKSLQLPGINEAYKNIHIPEDENSLDRSLKRFRFEEALLMQLRHKINADNRKKTPTGIVCKQVGKHFNAFYNHSLSFALTEAQKRVTREIRADLGSGYRMNRLLQGDVGSGKTVVAMMAALLAIDNGYQACLMAPTEILAQQHFATISKWITDLGLRVEILTGSTKSKGRKEILKSLADGSIHIIVGTHALIEDPVEFSNLGLAIIDEQHRFGVMQRARLHSKSSEMVHALVMTATPIPRTLALTFYGDLDVSVIDELPPGRKEIHTKFYYDDQRYYVIEMIRKQIGQGRQIYIVYPLIKESEKLDLVALEIGYEAVIRDFSMPKYEVGIMHGRMPQDEKDFVMKRFVRGLTNILVSTTVIEVGVDVPNASVMVIENAERFGLSQLHQLRGRVGRGNFQSYCILIGGKNLSNEAKVRLRAMLETTDGFKIAEADLKLRGPGDMMGTRQSGEFEFAHLDIVRDDHIITFARQTAEQICTEDPTLSKPENACLKSALRDRFKGLALSDIA
ncbi:MAG: ATP-dependent DNA helicase RecG [Bacteroidetes bacterium GWF2_43_63]|nr:MAG: ATP-dependent DNA helicase RecG [Bacteroidetes bacterium GWE2_42_42]OFY55970.1 MAG: ATP-dependent DNA helicase RecG [Bacteroidetes bacterium GWF2_43_63]HBG71535.1 ATP-dependent DNA helicase RecG [Bacteroidales bacterium]HCB63007.1 ATP-dependent DNA helicase RecG [Bacteroidales bacterium]HCY22296.1 ATP-dependent DNA helicase RecG [Bacteroidales bacterium]